MISDTLMKVFARILRTFVMSTPTGFVMFSITLVPTPDLVFHNYLEFINQMFITDAKVKFNIKKTLTLFITLVTINFREYRRCNNKLTIQRNWQHRVHKTKKNKAKTHTICVRHHYMQKNANNVKT